MSRVVLFINIYKGYYMLKIKQETVQNFLDENFCKEGSYITKRYFFGIKLWENHTTIKNSIDKRKDGEKTVGFGT